ncbi:hypothetical protein [Rhodoglobus aureus]|uniref:Uncharacterized protein n=1 Tax=Rhodoglobus aureus TaxID=191497 RepID=A0ABP4G240_9MICO
MTDPLTPKDLASELNVSAKQVREYLRSKYGTLPPFETRWQLSDAQASEIRAHFSESNKSQ